MLLSTSLVEDNPWMYRCRVPKTSLVSRHVLIYSTEQVTKKKKVTMTAKEARDKNYNIDETISDYTRVEIELITKEVEKTERLEHRLINRRNSKTRVKDIRVEMYDMYCEPYRVLPNSARKQLLIDIDEIKQRNLDEIHLYPSMLVFVGLNQHGISYADDIFYVCDVKDLTYYVRDLNGNEIKIVLTEKVLNVGRCINFILYFPSNVKLSE